MNPWRGIGHPLQSASVHGPGRFAPTLSRCSRSAWRPPPGLFSRCSLVGLSFSSPEDSRSRPGVCCLLMVSSGYALSIAIFFSWSLLLLALGWFFPRDLHYWWYLASGSLEFFAGMNWRRSESFWWWSLLFSTSLLHTEGLIWRWSWTGGFWCEML